MALERIPADIKADGGVARSSDPAMIVDVMNSCSIPVMAKARIGHFYEAKILQALDVDCIDESEVSKPRTPPAKGPQHGPAHQHANANTSRPYRAAVASPARLCPLVPSLTATRCRAAVSRC